MPLRIVGTALVKWLGGGTVLAALLGAGGWFYHNWQTDQLETQLAEAQSEMQAALTDQVRAESDARELRQALNQWQRSAEEAQRRADALAAQAEESRAQVRTLMSRLAEREQQYRALQAHIRAAPESDDGPVAPVLRDTMEALP